MGVAIGDLFADEPSQFGLRGDPWLWRALRARLSAVVRPDSRGALDRTLRTAFADEVGIPVSSRRHDRVKVERFAHGGMSSGMVSLVWWRDAGLPMVLERSGLPGSPFTVRSTVEDDWPLVRQARIENATDNPVSYGATLATTLEMTEEDWRMRARRGTASDMTSLVAIDDRGRWIGMMGAQDGTELVLTGVWVVPEARGAVHGVAGVLFAEVLAWARGRGDALTLWVDEGPAGVAARTFYGRLGFTPSGRRRPIGFAPGDSIEMVLPLR